MYGPIYHASAGGNAILHDGEDFSDIMGLDSDCTQLGLDTSN